MPQSSWKIVSRVSVVLFALLAASGQFSPAQTKPAEKSAALAAASTSPSAQYVGSDVCKGCHEEVFKKFEPNPHLHLLAKGASGTTDWHGCESCHGPGSAHVEAGGDVTKIVTFKSLSAEQSSAVCQQCHRDGDRSNFHRSSHLESGVGCLDCHNIHSVNPKTALLKEESPKLCYQCHTEQKAEFSRPYRHRVNEGLVQCSDCHNEHGGLVAKQLRTSAEQDQVCFKCHTEKKGPFVYEHMPVKTEGCTSCHSPHGSTNPRMLKVSQVNLLCLQCHTQSMSNTLSQPPIGPAHNQSQKYQACTMCHGFIHGSNFSEVFFKP